jgi:hypothetical protein
MEVIYSEKGFPTVPKKNIFQWKLFIPKKDSQQCLPMKSGGVGLPWAFVLSNRLLSRMVADSSR